jgi:hypothetical protein
MKEYLIKGWILMPNYYFIEIWTPLKFVGVRLFRDDEGRVWIKYWNAKRRRFRKEMPRDTGA